MSMLRPGAELKIGSAKNEAKNKKSFKHYHSSYISIWPKSEDKFFSSDNSTGGAGDIDFGDTNNTDGADDDADTTDTDDDADTDDADDDKFNDCRHEIYYVNGDGALYCERFFEYLDYEKARKRRSRMLALLLFSATSFIAAVIFSRQK